MSELEALPNILGKRTCRKCGQAGTLMVMPLIDDCARHWRLYNNKGIDYAFCIRCAHCGEVAFITKQTHEDMLRRQKYKRCLKIARWCFTKANYHFYLARSGEDSKENLRKDALYTKWRKRWLKIAEQFKEARHDQR